MGLMNLGKSAKPDDFDQIHSFSASIPSASTSSTSGGVDPLSRGGLPFGSGNQHSGLSTSSSSTSVKDWQEGFRALLPNVNISFSQNANLNNGVSSGSSSNLPPWDDPAIVTAANVSKHFNNNNSPLRNNQELRGSQEEQPHWMKSLQQLTEMTDSAPPKRAQGSSPSAFLPTLAGINQSSLLSGPFGSNSVQQQQQQQPSQQQHQQLMQSAILGNRSHGDRPFQMGGDWGASYSGGFSGPSMTSAPPGFRLPSATSGQPAPTGATN